MGIGVAIRRSRFFRPVRASDHAGPSPVRRRVRLPPRPARRAGPGASEVPVEMSRATAEDVRGPRSSRGRSSSSRSSRASTTEWRASSRSSTAGSWATTGRATSRGSTRATSSGSGPARCTRPTALTVEGLRGSRIHDVTLGHMLQVAKAQGYVDAYTMRSELKRASEGDARPRLAGVRAYLRIKLFGRPSA